MSVEAHARLPRLRQRGGGRGQGRRKPLPSTTAIPAARRLSDMSSPRLSQRNGVAAGSSALRIGCSAMTAWAASRSPAVTGRDLVQPVLRAVEGSGCGSLGDMADADDVPLELAQARVDHRRLGGDEADPPRRHREALAEAADQDHVSARPTREASSPSWMQRSYASSVTTVRPWRDASASSSSTSARVGRWPSGLFGFVRTNAFERGRHRLLDRLRIPARHRDEDAAGSLDQALEEVTRCRHDHLVARLEQRAECEAERVHGAVRGQDPPFRVGRRR